VSDIFIMCQNNTLLPVSALPDLSSFMGVWFVPSPRCDLQYRTVFDFNVKDSNGNDVRLVKKARRYREEKPKMI